MGLRRNTLDVQVGVWPLGVRNGRPEELAESSEYEVLFQPAIVGRETYLMLVTVIPRASAALQTADPEQI